MSARLTSAPRRRHGPLVEALEGRRLLSRTPVAPDFGDALPRNLSDAEKAYIRANPAPLARDGRLPSAKPAGAIDSVAEYEAMEGLVVSWIGQASWLSILAQIGRRVTVEGNGRYYVGVPNASTQTSATNSLNAQGANLSNVTFFTVPLNAIWARDYGPRYVYEGDAGGQVRVIADHDYNRSTRPQDDDQPIVFGNLKRHQYYEMGSGSTTLVHGGGNYHLAADGDAYATNLITDENPSLTAATVQQIWRDYQGNETTITGEFPLSVDATGHIDMWMQIYADKKVFISDWPSASGSVQDNICDATATLMTSRGYQVTRLPAYLSGGTHYTFANMVMMNGVVLLPQYNNGPGATVSTQVKNTVQAAMGAAKTVYGINADAIVTSAGVFHCIVQHVPLHRGAVGPNGGLAPTALLTGVARDEVYLPGETISLRWITDDDAPVAATGGVQAVDVQLSLDGGASWPTTLAANRPALGTFSWAVPAGIDTTAARIRAVARDAAGNVGRDDNGFDFTIGTPQPLATPAAPTLAAPTDTGADDADGVTNLNNDGADRRLRFVVEGVEPGAFVRLFADGVAVAGSFAVGTNVELWTEGGTPLADGPHVFTADQLTTGRPTSARSAGATVVVDTLAPTLLASAFEFQTSQRITFSPSEPLAAGAGDLTLVDRATGTPRPDVALAIDALDGDRVAVRGADGPIPDGDWTLSVAATDRAGNAASSAFAVDFFVLAGDADRDRAVTFADLVTLAQNYGASGRTFGDGNFDYSADGLVGFSDLVILAQRYGTTLPAAKTEVRAGGGEPTRRRGPAGLDELR